MGFKQSPMPIVLVRFTLLKLIVHKSSIFMCSVPRFLTFCKMQTSCTCRQFPSINCLPQTVTRKKRSSNFLQKLRIVRLTKVAVKTNADFTFKNFFKLSGLKNMPNTKTRNTWWLRIEEDLLSPTNLLNPFSKDNVAKSIHPALLSPEKRPLTSKQI